MATTKKKRPQAIAKAQEPRVLAVSGWSVSRIEQAKRLADFGDLSAAADLWERVLGDERALGPLQALGGIAGVPITFETAVEGEDSEKDPLVIALTRDFWAIYPEDIQREIIVWSSGLGVSLVHAEAWETDPETGRLLPRLDVWNPRALRYDTERAVWQARTRDNQTGADILPGDSEWQLFTPYGVKRPWTKGPWYGLGLLWFAAQCAKIDWSSWNDSHAQPIRAAVNEKAETHGLLSEADQTTLVTRIASLVRGGSLVLPDGYSLELVEAQSKNWESFVKLCDDVWPKAVAIALTGNNLTTQIEGGSFAASRTAENVSYDRKRTLARCFETTSRRECLTWWGEFNFGTRAVPWPKYQIEPPRDLTAAAARFQTGASGLSSLRTAGFEVEEGEEDKLEELLGVRVRKAVNPPPADPAPTPKVPPAEKVKAHEHGRSTVASANADGLTHGQRFVDALVGQAIEAGAKALAPDVRDIKRLIEEATDLRSLRLALVLAYGDMSPAAFAEVVERAEVLAAMAGRWSAASDV
jgi:hypothetical protein